MNLMFRASQLAISPLPVPSAWYAIPLRLIVGFGFMQHGYAKLARGPEDFINVLHAIGVPAAPAPALAIRNFRRLRFVMTSGIPVC